ncbi:hypothetical protein [Streptomyces sp. NPDC001719]
MSFSHIAGHSRRHSSSIFPPVTPPSKSAPALAARGPRQVPCAAWPPRIAREIRYSRSLSRIVGLGALGDALLQLGRRITGQYVREPHADSDPEQKALPAEPVGRALLVGLDRPAPGEWAAFE